MSGPDTTSGREPATDPFAFGTRGRFVGAGVVALALAAVQGTRLRVGPYASSALVHATFVLTVLGLGLATFGGFELLRGALHRRIQGERARLVLAGLEGVALGIVLFVLEPFRVLEDAPRAQLAALACGVGTVAFRLVAHRTSRGAALLALVLPIVVVSMRRVFGNVHYVSVHCALALAALSCGARVVELLRPTRALSPRIIAGVIAGGGLLAHLLLAGIPALRVAYYVDTPLGRALLRPLATLLDVDRDGAIVGFGSVDCDPFSASRGPFATERPGDGIDQDCDGRDGVRAPARSLGRTRPAVLPDVVLLSADGLRWDTNGRLVRTTQVLGPHTTFTTAVSPSPRTMNSFASVLRGRRMSELPFGHESLRASLRPNRLPTLGDALRRHGYRAVYVPPHAYLAPGRGTVTGFEEAPLPPAARRYAGVGEGIDVTTDGDDATAALLEVARTTPGPLLAMAHLMETHTPYRASREEVYGTDRAAYLRAVDATDARIAAFVEAFRAARARPVWFVIFGDHGEAFRERGEVNHSGSVNAEQVRIVFRIAGPDLPIARVTAPVSTSALPATLLDLLGLPPEPSFTVPSLGRCMALGEDCPTVAESDLFVVQRPGDVAIRGYTTRTHRAIVDRAHDAARVYELEADPYEQRARDASAHATQRFLRRITRGSAGSP